jgi:uncharacterized hydrophobic protein (TIGR00271 family)
MLNWTFLDNFKLRKEREDFQSVKKSIDTYTEFTGTNLWILFFAILVASLGLNINSTAVVIGAMLISPLMGPIVGLAFGAAINDLVLIKKAFRNYLFSAVIGLSASTIYFLLTPIDDAHSEILARTLPTIYDVFIALFGGFAGMIAICSKTKGNVIPGVAIATALMPPLCTAGYGLATWQLHYFIGAFYLYLINSVFIGVATFLTTFYLKFPIKKYSDPSLEKKEHTIIWLIIILTLLPSIYLGYNIVQNHRFTNNANRFIDKEAYFPNDYLLKKEIDPKSKTITLTFGGKEILEPEINHLKSKLKYYELDRCNLIIKQGFAFLKETAKKDDQTFHLTMALKQTQEEKKWATEQLDSLQQQEALSQQIYKELKVQYPQITAAVIQPVHMNVDTTKATQITTLVLLDYNKHISQKDRETLSNWLKVRLDTDSIDFVFRKK